MKSQQNRIELVTRPGVQLVEGVVVVALAQERDVGRFRKVGFVVEEMKHPDGFLGDHPQDGAVVVVGDGRPLKLLLGVLSLLQLKMKRQNAG